MNDHEEKAMNEEKQRALVCALASQLIDAGNWCGETHLQKAVYVAKHWLGVSEFDDHEFILYMYGPFSFDLKDELRAMCAEGWLKPRYRAGVSYGPTLHPAEQAGKLPETRLHEFDIIAKKFGDKNVAQLERLTTALLATEELGKDKSVSERVQQLRKWKLHFTEMEALQAVRDADDMLKHIDALKLKKAAA